MVHQISITTVTGFAILGQKIKECTISLSLSVLVLVVVVYFLVFWLGLCAVD